MYLYSRRIRVRRISENRSISFDFCFAPRPRRTTPKRREDCGLWLAIHRKRGHIQPRIALGITKPSVVGFEAANAELPPCRAEQPQEMFWLAFFKKAHAADIQRQAGVQNIPTNRTDSALAMTSWVPVHFTSPVESSFAVARTEMTSNETSPPNSRRERQE